ncbi:MAG: hypothetical protein HY367_03710 [Candidatus Aenigmarchaeota archaeon]|nr:hypothetical protein [Candidatus Aenigmarchaeota archaeon]
MESKIMAAFLALASVGALGMAIGSNAQMAGEYQQGPVPNSQDSGFAAMHQQHHANGGMGSMMGEMMRSGEHREMMKDMMKGTGITDEDIEEMEEHCPMMRSLREDEQ